MCSGLLSIIGLGLMASSVFAQSPATRMMAKKGWLADLGKGQAEARHTGKPLMVAIRCDP